MSISRSRDRINIKGGGILKVRQISPTASDTFVDLGWLGGTDIDDTRNMVDSIDERGLLVEYLDGGKRVVIKSNLKQSDVDTINLLRQAADKVYEIYYKAVLRNGNVQEFNIPLGKIAPGVSLKMAAATERVIPIEIHGLAVKADMARNPTDFNITEEESMVLAEGATEAGAPADTASTVYSTLY